jgi:hypothetical protein
MRRVFNMASAALFAFAIAAFIVRLREASPHLSGEDRELGL